MTTVRPHRQQSERKYWNATLPADYVGSTHVKGREKQAGDRSRRIEITLA